LVSNITPTSITLRYATLGNCIEWAYGFRHVRVIGPDWRDRPSDVFYEIVAKTSIPAEESQLKLMLQSLLKERLGFEAHRETRDIHAYALKVEGGRPKIQKSEGNGDPHIKVAGRYVNKFENFSMTGFVQNMENTFALRPVIDDTGLTGTFDFTLDLSSFILDPDTGKPILDARGAVDEESAYIRALPQQLGLKLEPQKRPAEVLIIDRVQKSPTKN
jgi:uncharacterized protein (TIGR03435 family)